MSACEGHDGLLLMQRQNIWIGILIFITQRDYQAREPSFLKNIRPYDHQLSICE
jgi:hypothetical protein